MYKIVNIIYVVQHFTTTHKELGMDHSAVADPAGEETWNLCSRLWQPFFYDLVFTGPGGGSMALSPPGSATVDDIIMIAVLDPKRSIK